MEELEQLRLLDQLEGEEKEKKIKELNKPYEDFIKKRKREIEMMENGYYYECYHDKEKFIDEDLYVKHFKENHSSDFPFYCDVCKKGFFAYNSLESHCNNSQKHKKKLKK